MGLFRERCRDFGRTSCQLRKAPGVLRNCELFMSLLTYFKVIDICCCKSASEIKDTTKCDQRKQKAKLFANSNQSSKMSRLLLKLKSIHMYNQ